jgi:hypothetical protein
MIGGLDGGTIGGLVIFFGLAFIGLCMKQAGYKPRTAARNECSHCGSKQWRAAYSTSAKRSAYLQGGRAGTRHLYAFGRKDAVECVRRGKEWRR